MSGMELTILIFSRSDDDSLTSSISIIDWNTLYRVDPEKTDITAGGASPPPRRYELLRVATDVISR
jgi:hypothetical protein